jgi:hypothetical protein
LVPTAGSCVRASCRRLSNRAYSPATIQISIGERVIDSDTDTASKRGDRIRELEAGLSRLTAKLSNPTERMMLADALGSQQRFKPMRSIITGSGAKTLFIAMIGALNEPNE